MTKTSAKANMVYPPKPADWDEFAPPHQNGRIRSFLIAVVIHLLLLAALAWGLKWKNEADTPALEVELWSNVVQQAAPPAQPLPPEAPVQPIQPPPITQPKPIPLEPKPVPKPVEPPKKPVVDTEADIALEKAKQKAKEKAAREKEREDQLQADKKAEQANKLKEDKAKADAEKIAEKREKEAAAKTKKEQDAERQKEAERLKNINKMMAQAGNSSGNGNDLKNAGPSGSYGGKINAAIRPHIIFTQDISGNPQAEVRVSTAPDGTIVGIKLIKKSGNLGWDDAVLKAIEKTQVLPRDIDGRVPSELDISFRPKD